MLNNVTLNPGIAAARKPLCIGALASGIAAVALSAGLVACAGGGVSSGAQAGMEKMESSVENSVVDGVTLSKHVLQVASRFYVPYTGADAGIKQRFPDGFTCLVEAAVF